MNEMRKLMEAVEQLEESDPTAGGRMRALYNDLSEIIKITDTIQVDFEKYPDLNEYRNVVTEVWMTCNKLRKSVGDVLK